MLRSILCPGWHRWVWSTQVEMHFVSLLEWDGFVQHLLRCILSPHWPGMSLVSKGWDTFLVLAGMGWISSTHVEILFEFSLPRDVFDHHVLRCILCITWHRIYMNKTSWVTLCVLADIGWVWSTHVGMHFVSSLAWEVLVNTCWVVWEVFGHHVMRFNLCISSFIFW